jgi:hypothetical protein
MRRILFAVIVALTFGGAMGTARADICGHMARLSSEWMTLKTYIDANDDDGLNMAEIQYISGEEHRLIVPTVRMMSTAINDPRPQFRGLAMRLNNDITRLDQIDDDGDWREDSQLIFRIAADLANLSRICQASGGGVPGGPCEQLAALAQHWERLRVYIDTNDDDGLNFAEAQYISREEHRLMGATMPLINQSMSDPRPGVRGLATRLYSQFQRLDQIDDDNNWEEDSQIIFRIAREIMQFTQLCRMGG